eukprot:m51a1_g12412 hypothetical protein (1070) ;mRNA; r:723078-727396
MVAGTVMLLGAVAGVWLCLCAFVHLVVPDGEEGLARHLGVSALTVRPWLSASLHTSGARVSRLAHVAAHKWPRALSYWFSAGAAVGVFALALSVLVLAVNLAIVVFSWTWARIATGATVAEAAGVAAQGQVVTPLVPGVNLPLSQALYLAVAAALGGLVHEAGHAIAAACEGVPAVGAGISVFGPWPAFYVEIADAVRSLHPSRRLRVFCAGAWHNLVLAAAAFVLLRCVPLAVWPLVAASGESALVSGLPEASPLAGHVQPLRDTLLSIGSCRVGSVRDVAECLWGTGASAVRDLGYCPPVATVDAGEGARDALPASWMLTPGVEDAKCCSPSYEGRGQCFELMRGGAPPVLLCLDANRISGANDGYCRTPSDCPQPRAGSCALPVFVPTNMSLYDLRFSRSAAYEGPLANQPRERSVLLIADAEGVWGSMELSDWSPRAYWRDLAPDWALRVAVNTPIVLRTLLFYVVSVSAGLGLLNMAPVFYLDGEWTLLCIADNAAMRVLAAWQKHRGVSEGSFHYRLYSAPASFSFVSPPPPIAMSDVPILTLSDTRLFKYRTYILELSVSLAWREHERLSPMAIVRAVTGAKVCALGSQDPLSCPRCGKVVLIHSSKAPPSRAHMRDYEHYVFTLRTHCTSSRDHLKTPSLVLYIDQLPTNVPLFSKPFSIFARVKNAKRERTVIQLRRPAGVTTEKPLPAVPDTESGSDEGSLSSGSNTSPIVTAISGPAGAVALVPSPPVIETQVLSTMPRMLLHTVKIDLIGVQGFNFLLDGWEILIKRELAQGYVGMVRTSVTEDVAFVVETFVTVFDAVRGYRMCGEYTANALTNVYNRDLTTLIHHLSLGTSWLFVELDSTWRSQLPDWLAPAGTERKLVDEATARGVGVAPTWSKERIMRAIAESSIRELGHGAGFVVVARTADGHRCEARASGSCTVHSLIASVLSQGYGLRDVGYQAKLLRQGVVFYVGGVRDLESALRKADPARTTLSAIGLRGGDAFTVEVTDVITWSLRFLVRERCDGPQEGRDVAVTKTTAVPQPPREFDEAREFVEASPTFEAREAPASPPLVKRARI